ncbi:MAG TPA: 16S rRNA (cytosine(967)-C(5))-methyltransferase RsmB [Burkholderiaceae bacterium]|nr:16S rRNA (cytosine(967)-C(5))-methyltransferase RsmB [Burkholderiaceae bacterium]
MSTSAASLADVLCIAAAAWQRFREGQSLDRAIAAAVGARAALRPAVLDVTYTAVRHLAFGEHVIRTLASRPPSPPVAALLTVAIGQLMRERHTEYTVVDQSVSAARRLPAIASAAGFVNALLRNFIRRREELLQARERSPEMRFNVPDWWVKRVRAAFPGQWEMILAAQGEAPPLVLRVAARVPMDDYLDRCRQADIAATQVGERAVRVHAPRPVAELPGFAEGDVSVQDAGAQLAAPWLGAAAGHRVLDACAAPGGKTAHLAEMGGLDLVALDVDSTRAARIRDNLERTGGRAVVRIGDAADPPAWWDARPFDRILLDAPCTASGIVRRHPDIPWLRRPTDVAQLATLQAGLLDALWPLLGVGGRLLYVVCSLFPDEGPEQIARFTERHPEAREVPLPAGSPRVQLVPTPAAAPAWDGVSALPTVHDGFFFALLQKT